MNKKFSVLTILVLLFCFIGVAFASDVYVKGYYKKNGTYVAPHYRKSPNSTVRDNFSYKRNVNPYTGKTGKNYYKNSPTSEYYNPSYKTYKNKTYKTPSYKRKTYKTPSYKYKTYKAPKYKYKAPANRYNKTYKIPNYKYKTYKSPSNSYGYKTYKNKNY